MVEKRESTGPSVSFSYSVGFEAPGGGGFLGMMWKAAAEWMAARAARARVGFMIAGVIGMGNAGEASSERVWERV